MSEQQHFPNAESGARPDYPESLIQLHIAEYNALTTRNTYWTTIQVAIWSVILLYITVAVMVWVYTWQSKPYFEVYIVWGSGIVIQLALATLNFTVQEIYRNVLYIECHLRSTINNIIGEKPFWKYESFLAKNSNKTPTWTDWVATASFLATLVVTTSIRHVFWRKAELLGMFANLPFSVFLILQSLATVKLRKRFESPTTRT
jgi:hypothetical protein